MPEIKTPHELQDLTRQELIEHYEKTIAELEKRIPALQRKLAKAVRDNDPKKGWIFADYLSRAFQIILHCRQELDALRKEEGFMEGISGED